MYSASGGTTPLTSSGRQTTPSRGRRHRVKTGKFHKMGEGLIAMVPTLHQGNIFTKRKLRVWRDQKCIPLVRTKTIVTCAGRQTTPS